LANPALVNGQVPDSAPVFSMRYAGFGHEAAGVMMLFDLVPWIAGGASRRGCWQLPRRGCWRDTSPARGT